MTYLWITSYLTSQANAWNGIDMEYMESDKGFVVVMNTCAVGDFPTMPGVKALEWLP